MGNKPTENIWVEFICRVARTLCHSVQHKDSSQSTLPLWEDPSYRQGPSYMLDQSHPDLKAQPQVAFCFLNPSFLFPSSQVSCWPGWWSWNAFFVLFCFVSILHGEDVKIFKILCWERSTRKLNVMLLYVALQYFHVPWSI